MNGFLQGPQTDVLKTCLLSAIETFNKLDAPSLLAPGKDDGKTAKKGSARWSGAPEAAECAT